MGIKKVSLAFFDLHTGWNMLPITLLRSYKNGNRIVRLVSMMRGKRHKGKGKVSWNRIIFGGAYGVTC